MMAGKHNIPKSKMHNNYRFLPDHIVCKIKQINTMRRAYTCDPALKLLNEEMTSDTHTHCTKPMDGTHWVTGTTYIFLGRPYTVYPTEHPIHSQHLYNIQQQITTKYKNIANCLTKQFTNTVKRNTEDTRI